MAGISGVPGVHSDVSAILSKIREISNQSKVFSTDTSVSATKNFDDIFSMTKNAISNVNNCLLYTFRAHETT
ncbi:MAG: hypothetical protein ABL857_08130, partial [Rickettsiales bacterium]